MGNCSFSWSPGGYQQFKKSDGVVALIDELGAKATASADAEIKSHDWIEDGAGYKVRYGKNGAYAYVYATVTTPMRLGHSGKDWYQTTGLKSNSMRDIKMKALRSARAGVSV